MASYTLTVIAYPASESNGNYEWSLTRARGGRSLAAGRGTITTNGNAAPGGRKPSVLFGTLPQTGSYVEPVGSKTG